RSPEVHIRTCESLTSRSSGTSRPVTRLISSRQACSSSGISSSETATSEGLPAGSYWIKFSTRARGLRAGGLSGAALSLSARLTGTLPLAVPKHSGMRDANTLVVQHLGERHSGPLGIRQRRRQRGSLILRQFGKNVTNGTRLSTRFRWPGCQSRHYRHGSAPSRSTTHGRKGPPDLGFCGSPWKKVDKSPVIRVRPISLDVKSLVDMFPRTPIENLIDRSHRYAEPSG